jgi:hypothetical protein
MMTPRGKLYRRARALYGRRECGPHREFYAKPVRSDVARGQGRYRPKWARVYRERYEVVR